MTTSRARVKGAGGMFTLPRRPSANTATPPSQGSIPHTPSKAPSSSPSPSHGAEVSQCVSPKMPSTHGETIAATSPSRASSMTPTLTREVVGPISECDDGESSPTLRSGNNDASQHTRTRSSISSPNAKADSNEHSATRQISFVRRMSRSSTAGNVLPSSRHTVSRDFALTGGPSSSLRHENCYSLRDQFIKIKERFSVAGPVTPSGGPGRTATVTPATIENGGGDHSAEGASHENEIRSGNTVAEARNGEYESSTSCTQQRTGAKPLKNHFETLHVPTERMLVELNQHTKTLYAGELLWPNHAHVDRWFVEDNCFKGSMTCWTMEKGAEIVARVANVISARSLVTRIVPDISLQWIGRQLWAVTVCLPLTRSGELTTDHAALAHLIDEAIGEELKVSYQGSDLHGVGVGSPPPLNENKEADEGGTNSSDSSIAVDICSHQAQDHTGVSVGDSATDMDQTTMFPATNKIDEASNEHDNEDAPSEVDSAAAGAVCAVHGETTASTPTIDEDGDTVAALPLSWSMLSLSSMQSTTDGTISVNGHGSKDDDIHVSPDKTGWLKKKDGWNSWQTRYFELKGNRLYYFASESEGIPRGAIILDHVHVTRGKGEHSATLTISASAKQQMIEIIKFSNRMTHQIYPRKSCILRSFQDTEEAIDGWVMALNRASFYCNLCPNASASASGTGSSTSHHQSQSSSSPGSKKRFPFYRFRSASSSASSEDDDNRYGSAATIDSSAYHHFGSVKYLQETDPLLWEIHPHDQQKIRKKSAIARTRADYLSILSKHSAAFRQIFLPRPRPITIEQTLRDILPELFLINNVLYGGRDGNNGLEDIFEVLDGCIKKFASAQEERVRAVSSLLQACARTISGGDSYFVVHSLLGNPSMIIRPAEARGHPIEIEVSATNPSQICITVFSTFSLHHIEDVENYGDNTYDDASGACTMPEPLLRVQTYHVQEFDFGNGKSSRWLRIHADGMKGSDGPHRGSWVAKRTGSETGFGALLDALS